MARWSEKSGVFKGLLTLSFGAVLKQDIVVGRKLKKTAFSKPTTQRGPAMPRFGLLCLISCPSRRATRDYWHAAQ